MEDSLKIGPRTARLLGPYPLFLLFLLIGASVELYFVAIQPLAHPVHRADPAGDPSALELANLDLLGRALKLHADEHDGKYPASIDDIHWRQAEPAMSWPGLPAAASRFHQVGTEKVMDWRYFPGHTENDPPDTILVASPVALGANGDHRMVSRINGVTEVIAESDYQRQVVAAQ